MATDSKVEIGAQMSVADDRLVIGYVLKNQSNGPVFVTNKIWRTVGSKTKIDAGFVYSGVNKNGLLTICKIVPELPTGRSPTNLVVPYMTRVENGESLTETIVLPLPLLTIRAYADNTPAASRGGENNVRIVSEVVFGLGLYIPPPGSKMWHESAFGVGVDVFVPPPDTGAEYLVVWSPKTRLNIPVLRRADD